MLIFVLAHVKIELMSITCYLPFTVSENDLEGPLTALIDWIHYRSAIKGEFIVEFIPLDMDPEYSGLLMIALVHNKMTDYDLLTWNILSCLINKKTLIDQAGEEMGPFAQKKLSQGWMAANCGQRLGGGSLDMKWSSLTEVMRIIAQLHRG